MFTPKLTTWQWDDKEGYPGYSQTACLVISPNGHQVARFTGQDIPGLVRVQETTQDRTCGANEHLYRCASFAGTSVYTWRTPRGKDFWPQTCWEEALDHMQQHLSQSDTEAIDADAFKACVRQHWPQAAARFDAYEETFQSLLAETVDAAVSDVMTLTDQPIAARG